MKPPRPSSGRKFSLDFLRPDGLIDRRFNGRRSGNFTSCIFLHLFPDVFSSSDTSRAATVENESLVMERVSIYMNAVLKKKSTYDVIAFDVGYVV